MEFFINKNATLPVLKMQVVKDGRSDYHSFMNLIEKSGIFFSMVNVETGIPKITSKAAGFVSKVFDDPNTPTEYYIFYKFSKKDTQKTGRYEGQFLLKNDEGDLIIPIREKLYINVNDSLISDENCCSDQSYLTPCPDCPQCPECPQPTPTPTPTPTTTPTPTPTPTTTPEPIIITLETIITAGSLNIDYNLYSNKVVSEDVNLSFTNTYGTSNGDVVVTTGVTINSGYTSGTTHIYLPDVDFNSLNGYVDFSGVTLTPSITNPENIIIEQIILDAILQTNVNEYIDVYNDFYLKFVDPSPTPTPTNTPTPSNTPTCTPTPTETPIQTQTPTPTLTLTPNCVRQIVIQTLWNGGTNINTNTLQLTQTSETLQIQVNDVITDNIGRTSFVGIVNSDGTYTYVGTGPGGGVGFNCQFPLTFSGAC